MPRYSDEWVIDRVLFDYVSGGSCACCGIQHNMFLPNGTIDLISSMTDLDTDQMQVEMNVITAAANSTTSQQPPHPWPKQLQDQIWCDRVKLKQKLKASISKYSTFWNDHGPAFTQWLLQQPPPPQPTSAVTAPTVTTTTTAETLDDTEPHRSTTTSSTTKKSSSTEIPVVLLQRCIQLSRSELLTTIQHEYQIHSAYMVVLTAVLEQVAHFEMTQYPHDSLNKHGTSTTNRTTAGAYDMLTSEYQFERHLQFGRMSGFTLPLFIVDDDDDNDNDSNNTTQQPPPTTTTTTTTTTKRICHDVLQILIDRIQTLGNKKLLDRGPSTSTSTIAHTNDDDGDEEENDDDDDADGPVVKQPTINKSSSSSSKMSTPTPSFQSDRRMLRLVLARYWADSLIQRYHADHAGVGSSSSSSNGGGGGGGSDTTTTATTTTGPLE